jgi:hypothetical protein
MEVIIVVSFVGPGWAQMHSPFSFRQSQPSSRTEELDTTDFIEPSLAHLADHPIAAYAALKQSRNLAIC